MEQSHYAKIKDVRFISLLFTRARILFPISVFLLSRSSCRGLSCRSKTCASKERLLFPFSTWTSFYSIRRQSIRDLRFRRPRIAPWFADFPYRGRALCFASRERKRRSRCAGLWHPVKPMTHTFPRFRIAIFHLVSHALPLAHRSVDCDVLSLRHPLLLCYRSSSFLKKVPRSVISQFVGYRIENGRFFFRLVRQNRRECF